MPALPSKVLLGGIDLGGTKIETALFTADLGPIANRRRASPAASYGELVEALAGEIRWLAEKAQGALCIGLGTPGVIDPQSGVMLTANLPATGQTLGTDLQAATGLEVVIANDSNCFALSEAHDGAGSGAARVFGLILGTGVAGGLVEAGQIEPGSTGLLGEIGHISLPAALSHALDLPLLICGCGRHACFETLVSGPGLTALHHHRTGQILPPQQVAATPEGRKTMAHWHALLAELLWIIQTTTDPDCIILGGGLSNIPGLAETLHAALGHAALPGVRLPRLRKAQHGDASGVRGAALLASRPRDRAFVQP